MTLYKFIDADAHRCEPPTLWLERFPRLKIVSAENDIAWVPHLMERADKYYRRWNCAELGCLTAEQAALYGDLSKRSIIIKQI